MYSCVVLGREGHGQRDFDEGTEMFPMAPSFSAATVAGSPREEQRKEQRRETRGRREGTEFPSSARLGQGSCVDPFCRWRN